MTNCRSRFFSTLHKIQYDAMKRHEKINRQVILTLKCRYSAIQTLNAYNGSDTLKQFRGFANRQDPQKKEERVGSFMSFPPFCSIYAYNVLSSVGH